MRIIFNVKSYKNAFRKKTRNRLVQSVKRL